VTSPRPGGSAPRARTALVGAAAAAVAWATLHRVAGSQWRRSNFRSREVSLAGGPALVAGGIAGTVAAGADLRLAGLLATVGGVGLIDDLWGQTHARGLIGHARALAGGTVTTGSVKLLTGITAALVLTPRRGESPVARLRDGIVIAGCANLLNLLDLRPGRALKAGGAACALLVPGSGGAAAAGMLGALAGVAGPDLFEHTMIGDCGANAAGAAVGWLLVERADSRARWLAAAAVTAGNLASERVSFSAVIDANPVLRRIDRLGRRE